MKFLVDAQLPRRLVHRLREAGHDAVHTLDLPEGNRTTDSEIISICEREQRTVITKDADFVASYWVSRRPPRLLLVSTGNIENKALELLFLSQLETLEKALAMHNFVELTRATLIIHE